MFWSEERVNAWYAAILSKGTEICHNLICLSPSAHRYWEKAHFALKPIGLSDDKKRLDIEFFWLTKSHHTELTVLQRPILSGHSHQGPNRTMLMNCLTEKAICSGDQITLETDDPVAHPLPNLQLLEMQWFLHRVTAAAEPQHHFGDDIPGAPQEIESDEDMDSVSDTDPKDS